MVNIGIFRTQLSIHICELGKYSDSNLPKLPPNANIFARWKRSFQKLILVSAKHPLTRFFLRSRAAIAFEKRRHGRSSYWWIIHPCSRLRFFWDFLMIITYLYTFVMVPHILTFHRIAKNSNPESWTIVYPAYVICIIDIALNFITGFVSHDGHEIFLDPILTARHYVRRYFFIDLVSSVPYTWFHKQRILPSGPNSNSIFLILEILPVLKLLRLVIILQLVESLAEPELKYQEITYGVENYIKEKKLPKHLQEKLLAYYEYRYQGNFFKEHAISSTLSSQFIENKNDTVVIKTFIFISMYSLDHLNQEITIHSSRGLLETATVLRNLPPTVLGNLITVLKPVIYMENDIIYKCHKEGDCMYFIASGTVALITFWGKEICHLEDGEHFGAEVLINPQNRRTETVLTLEVCELLRFDRRDFKRIVLRHSELYNRIEKDTIDRLKLIEQLQTMHGQSG
ncbi:hypothetical protein KPH14_011575 [Odynerus spinipes]|uniref:Cyclic nucleotide-binding domain-containing protein n=1 Tax=Odynerus spinipes TaxID=1348599 RepID=A0AAD9VMW5_9HYME|nr:hypothetical protein KPH14_011575 [Odynerus spinipes]